MGEFELIQTYFQRNQSGDAEGVALGIGDDCALLRPSAITGHALAVTTDTLIEGVHFFAGTAARSIGHKSLAVNLSDLAAMGAKPRWATLALSIPVADPAWLAEFSAGVFALADPFEVALVGGDTTRGPLSITWTLIGEVDETHALRRSKARLGDDVWVSGQPGLAHLAVQQRYGRLQLPDSINEICALALDFPSPRLALGQALTGVAHAAIDVSDGLIQDLTHIARQSGPLGISLDADALIYHPAVAAWAQHDAASAEHAWRALLAGGDDYELAFTAPVDARAAIEAAGVTSATRVTRIGQVDATAPGTVRVVGDDGTLVPSTTGGFNHFSTE
jgi:thiamine-monophosphate kinase